MDRDDADRNERGLIDQLEPMLLDRHGVGSDR